MAKPTSEALRNLLDHDHVRSGRVRWSRSVGVEGLAGQPQSGRSLGACAVSRAAEAGASPQWCLEELSGRVVELVGEGASALTTAATGLVREAQRSGEPVVWITRPEVCFYPPDVAACGVDLAALPVVMLGGLPGVDSRSSQVGRGGRRPGQNGGGQAVVRAMLRTVDQLVRSGAFGLVILDVGEATERASRGAQISLGALARLVGLAKQHGTALVWLVRKGGLVRGEQGEDRSVLGSFASLRAVCTRRRLDDGVFELSVEVLKDKRCGRGRWQGSVRSLCDGTVGLR